MDETRRFLRYVVPALVFLAEVALLLLVTPNRCLISDLPARLKDESAGFIALLIASTGGLGYLFSLAHHCLFWWCRWYGVDHRAFVREALDQKWLKIVLYGEWRDIRREHVTRRIAEDVIAILCYGPGRTRDAKDPALGETLVRRMDALSDLMNGLGTGFMAFIGAGAAWGVVYYWWCPQPLSSSGQEFLSHQWPPLVSIAVLFVLHFFNYRRVRNLLVRLVHSALATHFARTDEPAVIFVDGSALKRKHRAGGKTPPPP